MADKAEVEVRKNAEKGRYEAVVDGEVAGFAEYREEGGTVVLPHTVVEDAYEGKGVGSALARGALDDIIASAGARVAPVCPFIKGWIDKHPDYQAKLSVVRPEQGDGSGGTV